jgi:hypothetical protein
MPTDNDEVKAECIAAVAMLGHGVPMLEELFPLVIEYEARSGLTRANRTVRENAAASLRDWSQRLAKLADLLEAQ